MNPNYYQIITPGIASWILKPSLIKLLQYWAKIKPKKSSVEKVKNLTSKRPYH